ncbi:MAG: hypothetical protein JRG81_08275 [Deltaproteobacteria bacterium]|nr:hypothetical protein [Deltaproteobacteria bacterium]
MDISVRSIDFNDITEWSLLVASVTPMTAGMPYSLASKASHGPAGLRFRS